MLPLVVLRLVLVLFLMYVVIGAQRWPGDLIANKKQENFQQVPQPPLRRRSSARLARHPGEDREQQNADDDLDDHVLGDAEARLRFIQVFEIAKGLRIEQNLAAEVIVVSGDLLLAPLDRRVLLEF